MRVSLRTSYLYSIGSGLEIRFLDKSVEMRKASGYWLHGRIAGSEYMFLGMRTRD